MKLKSILWPAFLVMCMAAAGLAVALRSNPAKPPMRGFTLFMTQTAYLSNGAPFLSATKIRQHKSDGRWKLQTTYANGRVDVSYGEPGRGVFAVDDRTKTSNTCQIHRRGRSPISIGPSSQDLQAKK